MSEESIKVPDIGDVSDVEVIELCVGAGDQIEEGEPLIVLESDKASMEVPSPCSGKVKSLQVEVGSKVSEGAEIAVLEVSGSSAHAQESNTSTQSDHEPAREETGTVEVEPEARNAESGQLLVEVPDIGGEKDVEVIEIAVQPGDRVEKDDTLIVLESDKASMEVPSPSSGTVTGIKVKIGDKVSEGHGIIELQVEEVEADNRVATASQQANEPASGDQHESADSENSESQESIVVKVPDIGDAKDVEVIEIAVAEGDSVDHDDTLIVLESDKASMEIPTPHSGVVAEIHIQVGDKVAEGAPVLTLMTGQKAANTESTEKAVAEQQPRVAQGSGKPVDTAVAGGGSETSRPSELVYAGPAVRMLARELGVDLAKVAPTGPRERILKEDVQNYVKQMLRDGGAAQTAGSAIPAVPEVDFSQFGEVEVITMNRVQKLTASAMHRSWLNVPHVTHFDEADITDLEEFRALKKEQANQRGLKLTPLPFLLKACAAALRQHPQFNVSLAASGDALIHKRYCHIGIAMDTPAGLMVPVIRDVDKKGVWELAEEATELGEKGQQGTLRKDDLQGGCFTISSLGAIGGTGFTPIVNTPEVAILGVSKTSVKPLYLNNEFVPRKMLPLTLSYDHRAINGVDAGKFMTFLTQVLADIRKLVM